MKRIVIDGRIIPTGSGRYVEGLLAGLEQLNSQHQFIVLVREKDKEYWQPSQKNFSVQVADFADYSFAEQLGFWRFLNQLRPNLVHFCMPQQPVLYGGKVVTTVHDLNLLRITETDDMNPLVFKIKQAVFRWLLKNVAHKSSRILTPSEYTKRDLVEFSGIHADKVTVTYEAVGTALHEETPVQALAGKPFIMYVGRAEPYKNNRGLMKAHQLLLGNMPNLELVIVGKKDEYRTRDEKWAYQQGFKNITFTGFISDAKITWAYRHCKAYVFPSFMEGFGLPGLEAMAAGAPVVSSDSTCLPEIYSDAAVYFDAHKTTDMASAIKKVITNNSMADELRKKGQARAKQFSWRRMAEQTLAVYDLVLSK